MKKIVIKTCPTADFRTCDPARVAREDLLRSSALHKRDVQELMMALSRKLVTAGVMHDIDKVLDLDTFYANFRTNFEQDDWLQRHYRSTRHHLNQDEYVQEDVNLLDVLEHIVDCVAAGLARSGEVRPVELSDELLQKALRNTVELVQNMTELEESEV